MQFKMPKLTRKDYIGISVLVIVTLLLFFTIYSRPNPDCEIARPGYKCETAWNVMIEHCNYWGEFDCDSSADVSLPQVEWYIGNLCSIHNTYHDNKLDCSNLRHACNQVTDAITCPV